MITVMLSGSISKPSETRTSAKGNSYAVATIRTGEGDDAVFASITAFGDLAGTLAGLEKGSPIIVIGAGKIGTYEAKDGSGTRASLSVIASRIVALVDHQVPPRQRQHRTDGPRQTTGSQYRRTEQFLGPAGPREFAPDEPFQDKVPF